MNRFLGLIIILFVGFSITVKSQSPEMPTFNYLTIDLNTGNPTLYMTRPAFNPLIPEPTGYIIYKRIVDALSPLGRNEPIDTINIKLTTVDTSYTDYSSNGSKQELTYLIASNGPAKPSQLTSLHSSIFITSVYDSCNHKFDLTWTKYEGWGNKILKYDIYLGNDGNWAAYPLHSSVLGTVNRASILNIVENRDYYVYIKATKDTKDTGGTPYVTTSNLFLKKTTMPAHPTSMEIDSIIAENKKTTVFFKIDQNTELTNFQIVRWENPDSIKSIFSKKTLGSFDKSKTFYADTTDSWAARTRPFYYKIDALNSCPRIVNVTNHANSITPNVVAEKNMKNRIEWDELFIDRAIAERSNNSARYRVTRYAYKTTPLPPFYLPETDQLEQIDDVSDLAGDPDPYSIEFCYQIEAYERNLLGQIVMFSQSRIQCVEIIPGVTMPDAIIPTDNTSGYGNSRNILAPIITFRADYSLSIYNRWGNLIFNGKNTGWNGYTNGQLAKEGTYIYRLVVHTLGNRDVIKEGSFVVIYK